MKTIPLVDAKHSTERRCVVALYIDSNGVVQLHWRHIWERFNPSGASSSAIPLLPPTGLESASELQVC